MERGSDNEIVIQAGGSVANYWRDLWHYRELFVFLAWRDVLVRYKQTAIGILWCVLKPVTTMVVFTVIFGRLASLPSNGVPYPVLVFSAMLPWQLFAGTLTDCSSSLVDNANLLTKVYFPRLLVPAATLVVNLVDFAVAGAIFAGFMVWYGVAPGLNLLLLPAFLLLALLTAVAAGLWFAALNVRYRDFRFLVPLLVQFGLFVSPVGFSSAVVPESWRFFYFLNPMAGVIEGVRWAILGEAPRLSIPGFTLSIFLVLALLVGGVVSFRRMERSFADVV
ncbi:ABC transporter permease [Geomonas sp. Red69]|uniref:Transport permease protein n=1 Tax=Geomonas diazotrophica TaxID=2843197 RepID=A0ABX8JL44_9BACT|nr:MULTISPECIES: ABC transporter permease [Geomonas]MBU5636464.1 ABC transporter permease [Geomonas diazotrophica]QWV99033.1 ABC transporter permease [Geomonas nitrogeniifigens]QXE88199.1 ABC transporter permease [Geomonas nitrogeniifigens]